MTSERSVEGALLLDDVTLKRGDLPPVMAQGRPIGHITYSDHGYSVGAVLATAHVEREFAVGGAEVSVLGQHASVTRKAFFDPDGLRLRS